MANLNQHLLLVDSDAFCKLGAAGLFLDVMAFFGVQIEECGILPALPYMLKRGRLRRQIGCELANSLIHLADKIPRAGQPSDQWLDPLTPEPAIDPGEAQLLALSAEDSNLLLTGDKRSLLSVSDIAGYPEVLSGRVVVLEAMLIGLCHAMGTETVRSKIGPFSRLDMAVRICFSATDVSPLIGLTSYFDDLSAAVKPLTPNPPMDGARIAEGGEEVTDATVRARIRVDWRLAGGLSALLGVLIAACDGCGERDGGIGHGKKHSRTGPGASWRGS